MAKHKYIETPEDFERLFDEYIQWCKENNYIEQNWVGKEGTEVEKKIMRHVSFDGFEGWLCENKIISDLGDYSSNKDGRYTEYATIITRIRKICKGRLLTAAISNVANGNIVSRYLGLADTQKLQGDKENPLAFDITLNIK